MAAATLTSKGQLTVPKEVRDRLGVKEGDRLVFRFDEHGGLRLEPECRSPVDRLAGLLKAYGKDRPVSREEMKEAAREHAVEKDKRSRR